MSPRFAPDLTPENMSNDPRETLEAFNSKPQLSTIPSITSGGEPFKLLAPTRPNEASRGVFSSALSNIGGPNGKGPVGSDSGGYGARDVPFEDDLTLWSNGDGSCIASNSSQTVSEQAIARGSRILKRLLKRAAIIDAALQQITPQDLANSPHRPAFEQYANEMEALLVRIRGLLYGPVPSSQSNSWPPITAQHPYDPSSPTAGEGVLSKGFP